MIARALVVLAKLPGQGKTRLVPALGEQGAFALAEAMLLDTLEALDTISGARVLAVAGGEPEAARRYLPSKSWRIVPQHGADLGARIERARQDAGARAVAIVGTDAPLMTAARIEAALAGLDRADVVVGPTLDGGYDVLALRGPAPAILGPTMPWSTDRVMAETRARAQGAGLVLGELDLGLDVDVPEDLPRALAALASAPAELAPRTRACLARLC